MTTISSNETVVLLPVSAHSTTIVFALVSYSVRADGWSTGSIHSTEIYLDKAAYLLKNVLIRSSALSFSANTVNVILWFRSFKSSRLVSVIS